MDIHSYTIHTVNFIQEFHSENGQCLDFFSEKDKKKYQGT